MLERVDQGGAESTTFCGLPPLQTYFFVGLRTDVQKYGRISEDVALGEHHVEFADWQLLVPFDTATVKHVYCPEDIDCEGESQHDSSTCCTFCVAPMCTECQSNLYRRMPEFPLAALTNDMMIYSAP